MSSSKCPLRLLWKACKIASFHKWLTERLNHAVTKSGNILQVLLFGKVSIKESGLTTKPQETRNSVRNHKRKKFNDVPFDSPVLKCSVQIKSCFGSCNHLVCASPSADHFKETMELSRSIVCELKQAQAPEMHITTDINIFFYLFQRRLLWLHLIKNSVKL